MSAQYSQMQFAAGCKVDASLSPAFTGQQFGVSSVIRLGPGVYRVVTEKPYGIGECIPVAQVAENVGLTNVSSAIQTTVGAVTAFDITVNLGGVPSDIDFFFLLISLIG